jgi:FkbM family methyltransferase
LPLARIPFDAGRVICEMPFGAWILVDMQNIDVAPGIWRDGVIEPWTTTVFRSRLRSGDVVIDLGANHGYYTTLAASIVGSSGRVAAFEANPRTFSNLMRTVYFSGVPHIVDLYWRAVSDRSGDMVRIVYDVSYAGGGSVHAGPQNMMQTRDLDMLTWSPQTLPGLVDAWGRWEKGRGVFTEAYVGSARLDDIPGLGDRPIRLFKLDIEGHEPQAILGARNLIAQNKGCSIIMEWFGEYLRSEPARAAKFEEMLQFLFVEQGFKPSLIQTKVTDDVGQILQPVSLEAFRQLHHCDVLLER